MTHNSKVIFKTIQLFKKFIHRFRFWIQNQNQYLSILFLKNIFDKPFLVTFSISNTKWKQLALLIKSKTGSKIISDWQDKAINSNWRRIHNCIAWTISSYVSSYIFYDIVGSQQNQCELEIQGKTLLIKFKFCRYTSVD